MSWVAPSVQLAKLSSVGVATGESTVKSKSAFPLEESANAFGISANTKKKNKMIAAMVLFVLAINKF
jgi:hypothetical protein